MMVGWFVAFAWAERPITLNEAVEAAIAHNPALAQAQSDAVAAEAQISGAAGTFDPVYRLAGHVGRNDQKGFFQGFPYTSSGRTWDLSTSLSATSVYGTSAALSARLDRNFSRYVTDLSGTEQEKIQDAFTTGLDLSLSQQVLEGNGRSYNLQHYNAAKTSWDAAKLQTELDRQATLEAVTNAWWEWQYASQAADITRDALTTATEADRVGAAQLTAGTIAPVDRTRLAAALVTAQTNVLTTDVAAKDARDALLVLMGEQPGQDVIPASIGDGAVIVVALDVPAITEKALAQNPAVLLARNQVDLAKIDLAYSKNMMLPSLYGTVDAGLGSQEATGGDALSALFTRPFSYIVGGAVFEVPIGNRAAKGTRDAATAVLHSRELALEATERQIASEVQGAARALEAAMRGVDNARAQARLADDLLKAEEARLSLGRALQKDVLEARAGQTQAHVAVYRALADYHRAEAALARLQGQLGK